jgi:RHS repeat-associated protein
MDRFDVAAEVSSCLLGGPASCGSSTRVRGELGAGLVGVLTAILLAWPARAAAPLCDNHTYCVTTCEQNELNPKFNNIYNKFSYCATGAEAGHSWSDNCDPATFVASNNQATACPNGVGDGSEIPGNEKDDNANGCIDEGTKKGEAPCDCTRACKKLVCNAVADCNPSDGKKELCGDAKDNNCNEKADEGCFLPQGPGGGGGGGGGPFGGGGGGGDKCCDCKAGKDPIALASRLAVTEPFSDFSVDAVVQLAVKRSWNSGDASLQGGAPGIFGRGWHHQWEGTLTCVGDECTVGRGALAALQFKRAETASSPDGSETWQIYRPAAGMGGPSRRQLLAKRPDGTWIVFMSDGTESHFATACDACGDPDRFCSAPEAGGAARLVKWVDERGNAINVSYSRTTGLLLGLTDGLGHSLELKSSTACTDGLARELYYDGLRVVTYAYDGLDLASATDADGATLRAYTYESDGSGLLRAIHDEAGMPIVEFSYDTSGDAVGIVDEESSILIQYSTDGSVTVSEAHGFTVSTGTRRFNPDGTIASVSEGCACGGSKTYGYVGDDRVCATDGAGESTYDEVDALGRVTRHRVYQGTACPPGIVLAYNVDETRTYGVTKQVAQGVSLALDMQTSESRQSTTTNLTTYKAVESWDYDPAPKSYDPVGYECAEAPLPAGAVVCRHITSGYVRTPAGPVLERHATFYAHDGRGRVTTTIGPVNLDWPSPSDVVPVEEKIYFADTEPLARRGRLGEIRRWPSPTSAPLATTFDYDLFGVYRMWLPEGRFTTWLKDGRGRSTIVLESDGRSTETRFHDGDKPRLRILPGGEVERTSYDLRGRVVAVERLSADPDVPGSQVSVLWGEYHQYDPAGNRSHSERRDASGAVVWKQDREYDVQHRLVKESHPELPGASRSWEYGPSGFLTRTTDEEGRATVFTPEVLGRVKSVARSGLDANGTPVTKTVASYRYQSWVNSLQEVTDGAGLKTSYKFDDFGRLEDLTTANSRGVLPKFTWDLRGNLLQRKDNYVTVGHTYDGLDRLRTTTATNAQDGASVAYAFGYDESGAAGRLTSVIEPERTIRFGFDGAGRLTTERQEENGVSPALVTEYRYDAAGRLSELVYPTGLRLAYDRDPVTHEVKALKNAVTGESYAGGVSRLANGPVAAFAWANGKSFAQGFNTRWEPTSLATGPMALQFTPTPAGDVGQIVENGLTLPFRYDYLDRLVESSGWFTHGHDGNGNRTSEWLEGTPLTYGYTYDRLKLASTPGTTPVKRWAFAYDYQANVSWIGKYDAGGAAVTSAVCLRHDPLARLVMAGTTSPTGITPDGLACTKDVNVTSVTARFKYDHRNRRVASWRAATGEWVYTVFDQDGQPLAEVAKTTDPVNPWRPLREYVWLDGKPVIQIERDAAGASRTYALHADAIGLPRALTSPSGATVWTANPARPYGDVLETTTPDPETGRTVVTNLRLPGQYDEKLLASVGLQGPYYNWNRWYLPSTGRYLELDPVAKDGGFNRSFSPDWYSYAEGNSLRYTDPDGRFVWALPLICMAGGCEALANLALIGAGVTLGLGLGDVANKCIDKAKEEPKVDPFPPPPPLDMGKGCSCVCYERGKGPNALGQKSNAYACQLACSSMGYSGYKCGGGVTWPN